MAEQTTAAHGAAGEAGTHEVAELREELAEARQEILRLRDLLVAKDAELGTAKGRLAELDDRSQRIAGIASRIESKLPGMGRLLGTAVRMLRTQRR